MRRAKILGAIAWYLECPACGSGAIYNDSGTSEHGHHDASDTVECHDCGIELRQPKLPKKIAIY